MQHPLNNSTSVHDQPLTLHDVALSFHMIYLNKNLNATGHG